MFLRGPPRRLAPSTIAGVISGISDWHRRQAASTSLAGLPSLANPCSHASVTGLLQTLKKVTARRAAKSRLPITMAEFAGMMRRGFHLHRAWGHHRRLCLLISTLGCLRRTAVTQLRVSYTVDGSVVSFTDDSDVEVLWHPELRERYIRLHIRLDKNVAPGREVYTYIPERVPALGVSPVQDLLAYVLRFRPPSGGYLFSAPKTAALGPGPFHSTPYTQLGPAFREAFLTAFPLRATRSVDASRVASHSGRKSLCQWLWDMSVHSRLIIDIGHWAVPKDAFNLYFLSSPAVILKTIRDLSPVR